MMAAMPEIAVGTASWTGKTLLESGKFYPPGVKSAEDRIKFYPSQFSLVEVDVTYYGMPNEQTALLWADRTGGPRLVSCSISRLMLSGDGRSM